MLTESQTLRFARHVLVREIGGTGQARLLAATVRLPRLDEPGRACALWLVRSGIGRLIVPDDRSPAPSIDGAGLVWAQDAGRPLVEAVVERLRFHGPDTQVESAADANAGAGEDAGEVIELDPSDGPGAVLALIARIVGLHPFPSRAAS